ncbi:MAG: isoleucine--tRNA ligase [Chloroflexota bacterium]|nr:isoleucine--tRNA ligase [Chloroflexota bacterium]
MATPFKRPPAQPDLPAIEESILGFWEKNGIFEKLRAKNRGGPRHSFIDGPITANNPMGVHHAWGRTYKDVYTRYRAMRGFDQRYQNGFDCQGLWVEVEVERDLGLNSKREIEEYGLDNFSRACADRVRRFGQRITEQSKRLGMWMDWSDSYYTHSDSNIEHIWHFLKTCHENGWLRRGHRVMPWCTRCGTSLSQHELLGTDTYQELTHTAVTLRLPLVGKPREHLLVWTTTPWTLAGNVACAVSPDLEYVRVRGPGDDVYILSRGTLDRVLGSDSEVLESFPGSRLLGLRYEGPWDELPPQHDVPRRIVAWEEVAEAEGTGIVHIAPGSGAEDYELGQSEGLPALQIIDGEGIYRPEYGELAGRAVADANDFILASLRAKGLLLGSAEHTHRYPVCWRCKQEIVFNLVDEWFIACDQIRPRMIRAAEQVDWIPDSAGLRMRDWLENMGDWAISRKRYWGLPLPFYQCPACQETTVIGSVAELRERAVDPEKVDSLPELHRPWIDEVEISCHCGQAAARVPEVGDCWLDAGIVPFSTLDYLGNDQEDPDSNWNRWYPANFITEMREQIRLWFYSMLFMSVAIRDRAPYETCFVYEKVMDDKGQAMHRSFGNAIGFDEAVDRMGADVMRWMYVGTNPNSNVRFGYGPGRAVVRRFLTLWNIYAFFLTYAELDGFDPASPAPPVAERPVLDRWILSRLGSLQNQAEQAYEGYWVYPLVDQLEHFWDDVSNWYVRLCRRRYWKSQADADKAAAYATLYQVLGGIARLMGPLAPFLAEELYQNLEAHAPEAPESLFLCPWPTADEAVIDAELESEFEIVRAVISLGRAARAQSGLKNRQPLAELVVGTADPARRRAVQRHRDLILAEVNVKSLRLTEASSSMLSFSLKPNFRSLGPRFGRSVNSAARAIAELDAAEVAARLESGESVAIQLDGRPEELSDQDLIVRYEGIAGLAVAVDSQLAVGISTELDSALELEGLARELVHAIQGLRRDAGFEIADRISLAIAGPDLPELLAAHAEEIAGEVLAENVRVGSLEGAEARGEIRIGDSAYAIELERQSPA